MVNIVSYKCSSSLQRKKVENLKLQKFEYLKNEKSIFSKIKNVLLSASFWGSIRK